MDPLTHPTIENGWFREQSSKTSEQVIALEVNHILHAEKSCYYDILVFESKTVGNVLVLDGRIQYIERNDFSYQEMIAHIPLSTHPNPKKVLVIGGGDGTVVREVLKHKSVEHVVLCDIDEAVVRVSKKFFSHMVSILSSPRVHILLADGFKVLAENTSTFDIVIVENTEPIGPTGLLFQKTYFRKPYFQLLYDALAPDGHISIKLGPTWSQSSGKDPLEISKGVFPVAKCAFAGQDKLIIAAKAEGRDITKPIRSLRDTCYWSEQTHQSAFVISGTKCVILKDNDAQSGQSGLSPLDCQSVNSRRIPLEASVICESLDVVLYGRYGFDCCTTSFDGQVVQDSSWEKTQKYLVDRVSYIASNLRAPIIDFVEALIKCAPDAPLQAYPSSELWDLRDSHLSPISQKTSPFFRIVQRYLSGILVYSLEPISKQTTNWYLVVPQAVTALQCLREEWGPLQENVVQKLVERGIPFQTWQPIYGSISPLRARPRSSNPGLGFRPPAFRPDFTDYVQYTEARDDLFRRPYARAALLKGGIVWRLAIEALGYAPAMEGPSESAFEHVVRLLDGIQVFDDALSEEEIELICGVYHVYTGQGRQVATMSWWPKPSAWTHSGLNVGYWTPSCEEWFQRRLDLIRSNKASLKSGNDWRQGLSFHSRQTSRMTATNERASAMHVAGRIFP